jgi:antitoxin PrlF
MAHQVTVKGQVTIPKKVCEYLGIGPGSGVEFELDAAGAVLLRKAGRSGKRARARSAFAAVRGTRKTGMCTEEIMELLRGYAADAREPGLGAGDKRV